MKQHRLIEALGVTGSSHTATWSSNVVDVWELIKFAEAWRTLGERARDQVRQALTPQYGNVANLSTNTLDLAQERIGGYHEDIDEALENAHDLVATAEID